jgi:hypothetical protein
MSRTVAFLDACVLYPFSLRDVLMQFSVEGRFQANLESARAGFDAVVARRKTPPRSKADYCEAFKKNRLPKTAAKLEYL